MISSLFILAIIVLVIFASITAPDDSISAYITIFWYFIAVALFIASMGADVKYFNGLFYMSIFIGITTFAVSYKS